jgi:MoxR-like ATPase
MARVKGCEAVYEVADQWRERCLVQDGSLLWPELEEPTWTVGNLEVVIDRLAQPGTDGTDDFFVRINRRMAHDSDAVHRIFADATAVWSLMAGAYWTDRKLGWLQGIVDSHGLSAPQRLEIVTSAYDCKLCGYEGILGRHAPRRGAQLRFFLHFSKEVKQQNFPELHPQFTRNMAYGLLPTVPGSENAQDMLLHLLCPDYFEAVTSQKTKSKIASAFPDLSPNATDVDDALRHIRENLSKSNALGDLGFYDREIRKLWDHDASPFRAGAAEDRESSCWWVNQGDSYTAERDGSYLWAGKFNRAGRTIPHHETMKELRVGDLVLHYAAGSIRAVSHVDSLATESARPSLRQPEAGTPDGYLVNVTYEELSPPIQLFEIPIPMRAGGEAPFTSGGDVQQVYLVPLTPEWAYELYDRFKGRWPEVSSLLPTRPAGYVAIEDQDQRVSQLTDLVHGSKRELNQIQDLLRHKKHLIFEGPPGSGKTFIADKFARYFTGNSLEGEHDERIEFVQFHQSYGYEDFVQGIRPVTEGGALTYRVVPGIFLEMCERAEARPDDTFVLIIDEINRGNLSRIFGELLMALEYRDKPVKLANAWIDSTGKSRTHLTIPENLYLIGTMNSTDRSLAMIDYALRRRFYFYPLRPVVDGEAPVLERWLASSDIAESDRTRLLRYFVSINQRISDHLTADFQVGHSYFMNEQVATESGMQQVWDFALKPLLQEYFHSVRGGTDFIDEFDPAGFGAPAQPDELNFDEDQPEL